MERIEASLSCSTATPEILANCRSFFETHALPLLTESPILQHACRKPYGYPGDYEIIEMVHQNGYRGSSWYAKLLNHYVFSIPIADAVRRRTNYLTRRITEVVERTDGRHIDLFSVACGPAIEYRQIIEKNSGLLDGTSITLLDQEKDALEFAERRLGRIIEKQACGVHIHYLHNTVEDFLQNHLGGEQRSGFDFIYSFGLFDYFDRVTSRLVIKCLLALLKPSGKLLIANVSAEGHRHRYFMDVCLDWPLIYRDPNDLEGLVKDIDVVDSYRIDALDGGTVNFLEIQPSMWPQFDSTRKGVTPNHPKLS
jgi:2-polyprenyl-3-methyl-5-hydroxy-6-metoxy-1,4-benzoquinol methylase